VIYLYPALLLVVGLLYIKTRPIDRNGMRTTHVDLGDTFMLVMFMYGFIPSIGFLLALMEIGEMIDHRLASGFINPEVEYVQWMHLALVSGFIVTYRSVRRSSMRALGVHVANEATMVMAPLVVVAGMVTMAANVATSIWGADVGGEYISSYTALRQAPLIVQQLVGILSQLQFATLVAAVVAVVAAKPRRHHWVAIVLMVNMLIAGLAGGSRSVAFLSFFAYIVAASIFVPGFTLRKLAFLAIPALAFFMIAGMWRDNNSDANLLHLFQTGEFTTVFINALDLKDRLSIGIPEEIRFAFYFVDLIRLIPRQFVGDKLDPAQWYAETFYPEYYSLGGGFAFGVLAESVAGFGIPEALIRGALLGLFFAYCANRLLGERESLGRIFMYVWAVVLCFVCYRDTTFSLIVRGLYQLVPMLLLITLFKRILSHGTHYRDMSK
jgi:oligosaccharide repeat unit polymerase